jgi:murein DD-endopeptidase MepM/ murein hydrolase activator NlpD
MAGITGTVTNLTTSGPYGNRVEITSPDGLNTVLYAHMNSINVSMGQPIIASVTQIGTVGTTGNSTGDHLHIELVSEGVRIDPLFVLGYAPAS